MFSTQQSHSNVHLLAYFFAHDIWKGGFMQQSLCRHEKRFEKPIFLLTNMDLGEMACRYHKKRFKIETMFKQLKSKAFIFTYCMGCFIKSNIPVALLETFVRKDKVNNMGFIAITQKCRDEAFNIAVLCFSDLSKNFDWVFT